MSFEHIFDELEIAADPFALCELRGQSTLGLAGQPGATLHYILTGNGELVCNDHPPIRIGPGTLALVPSVQAHTLRSFGERGQPLPDCHPAELDLASHLVSASDPSSGKLLAICARVSVGLRGTSGLVNLVREPLIEVVVADDELLGPVDQLLRELSSPTMGSRAMVRAILLQCIVHLLRNRLLARDHALNWMAALIDEKLWAALQKMLDAPGHAHSVESLADIAGMSRSSFADRFSSAYGSGPMELLRELRMHKAASLLSDSGLPVKRIAELVGFQSRSAFSRTFTITTGKSPHDFRSEHHKR